MNPLLYERRGNRLFTDSRINDAINDALSALGEEDGMAVVAHHVYEGDVNVSKLSVVYKKGKTFTVSAAAFKDWVKNDAGVEAQIIWTPGKGRTPNA